MFGYEVWTHLRQTSTQSSISFGSYSLLYLLGSWQRFVCVRTLQLKSTRGTRRSAVLRVLRSSKLFRRSVKTRLPRNRPLKRMTWSNAIKHSRSVFGYMNVSQGPEQEPFLGCESLVFVKSNSLTWWFTWTLNTGSFNQSLPTGLIEISASPIGWCSF